MKTHKVYIIELSKAVWKEKKKFREANKHYNGNLECLYVGITKHDPIVRFKKHITGYRNKNGIKISSRIVEKYGLYLRPTLYEFLNPISYKDAKRIEEELSDSLRKRGYAVWWN